MAVGISTNRATVRSRVWCPCEMIPFIIPGSNYAKVGYECDFRVHVCPDALNIFSVKLLSWYLSVDLRGDIKRVRVQGPLGFALQGRGGATRRDLGFEVEAASVAAPVLPARIVLPHTTTILTAPTCMPCSATSLESRLIRSSTCTDQPFVNQFLTP